MEVDNSEYFTSYENLEIHEIMLKDKPRNEAYRKAIFQNKSAFEGKIILDVGSGTGFLSIIAAQAGAKKVYAIEASNVAQLSKKLIESNGFGDVIEIHQTKIEDFILPNDEKVDVIISEWMGFYLLHEGMLDSVLYARDKFMKSEGLLFPDRAMIYCAPCSLTSHFEEWENICGINMSTIADELRRQKSSKPEVLDLPKNSLLADPQVVAFIDLNDITSEELDHFKFDEVVVANVKGKFQGLCLFFEVFFPSDDSEDVVLSTNPESTPTHWKQTVVPLPTSSEVLEISTPIAFILRLQRNPTNHRQYNIFLELLDAESDDVEHPLPCECYLTKCIISKAHLAKMTNENNEK